MGEVVAFPCAPVRNDYRQRFFWRPGMPAPQRAPDLGAAVRG